jgi:drug/metabolite transporter (DMT)-like permease
MLPVTSVGWRARFFTLAAIWGLSFLFIKEAVQALAPLQVVAGRMVIGMATLLAFLAARRERLPRGIRTWAHLSVAATLNNVLPFTLFAYAELRIGSALAGICNASAPLFAALVALAALPDERLSRRRGLGLLLGFCGVFVVLGAWDGLAGHDLAGALLALGGGLCYGIGFPYTRRFLTGTGNSSLSLAAGQLLCGSAMLAVLTPALTGAPAALPLLPVLSVTALGALGTGVAYILNYGIITRAGATIAATVAYLMPLVSVLAGVAVLGERLAWNQPAGAAVIIAGAALAQTRARVNPSVRTARRWPRRPGTPAAAPAAVPGRSGHGCERSHPAPTSARRRSPQPLPRSGRRR